MLKEKIKVGDIQIDENKSEWIVIGVTHMRRNSLAHKVHSQISPIIAKSYVIEEEM